MCRATVPGVAHPIVSRGLIIALLIVVETAHGQGRAAAQSLSGSAPKPAIPHAKTIRSCESLAAVTLPNTTIESARIDPEKPDTCLVTVITTHPPAGDRIRIWIAIPTLNWNGRFLGMGGSGFLGRSAAAVNEPATLGYASSSTDTGHEGGSGSFALDANGRLNWQAIRDNAHVGIHEMTTAGKALTQAMGSRRVIPISTAARQGAGKD